jgi:hypothetical protein
MDWTFGGLDALAGMTIAAAPPQALPVPLVRVPAQELGDCKFNGFLEHELRAQTDGLQERSVSGCRAEELFFEGLAGEWAFAGCLSLSVKTGIRSLRPISFYRKLRTSPDPVGPHREDDEQIERQTDRR